MLISLQGLFACLLWLKTIGFELTETRIIVGFSILCISPGFSLLRIFRIHGLEAGKTLLLALGLSLSFLMGLGAFGSAVLPVLGYKEVLVGAPFLISLNTGLLLLLLMSYLRDRDYQIDENRIEITGGKLFKHEFRFPSAATEGTYRAESYVFMQGKLVGKGVDEIRIKKTGIEAAFTHMAFHRPVLYGIMAVLVALGMGLLVGFIFKKGGGH